MPLTGLQIGILSACHHVAGSLLSLRVSSHRVGRIVGEGHIVYLAGHQVGFVGFADCKLCLKEYKGLAKYWNTFNEINVPFLMCLRWEGGPT